MGKPIATRVCDRSPTAPFTAADAFPTHRREPQLPVVALEQLDRDLGHEDILPWQDASGRMTRAR